MTSRVLCGLPPLFPASPKPFYSQGLRLHSSRLPLAVGRLLVFFLQVTALIPSCLPLDLLRCPESACFPGSLQNVASSSVPPLPLLAVSLSHHRLRDTLRICCLAAITEIEVFCRLALPAALSASVFPDSGIVSVGDRC